MLIRPSRVEQKMPRVEIVPRNYNEAFRGPPFVRNLESDEKKSFWPPTLAQNLKPNQPTRPLSSGGKKGPIPFRGRSDLP